MIEIEKYAPEKARDWDQFVTRSRCPMFMFNRGFMDYHADRFEDASLMFYRDDELIAVLPATHHGDEIRSHGGLTYGGMIVGERMKQAVMLECFGSMRNFYRAAGVRSILYKQTPHIYKTQSSDEDLYALFRCGASVVKVEPSTLIRLDAPLKMPKGRKAQISRARREGVIVADSDDFETFISLENAVLERHNVRAVHSPAELRLLKSRFPDNIRCLCAWKDGLMVAGTLLFVYGTVVHTQYMFASEQGRTVGALDLVISQVLSDYAVTHAWLDFGISSEDGGRYLNEGLIGQKESFGGRTLAYVTCSLRT